MTDSKQLKYKIDNWREKTNLILLYPEYDTIDELEDDWNKFQALTLDEQKVSDEQSVTIYGITNTKHYDLLLSKLNTQVNAENAINNLYYTIQYDQGILDDSSSSIQESVILSDETEYKMNTYILENNPDVINTNISYPYYTPNEIERYLSKFDNIVLPLKESLFINKWKYTYSEGFNTGDFTKVKELANTRKAKITEIKNNSELNKDIKNKMLLSLGCNYSLPLSNQDKRLKSIIQKIYNNIRVYDTSNIPSNASNVKHYDDFIKSINLWIVYDNDTNSIASYSSIPQYPNRNINLYCTQIKNNNKFSGKVYSSKYPNIKMTVASIIGYDTPAKVFKVFSGPYNNFDANKCLGLNTLYELNKKQQSSSLTESTIFNESLTNEFPVEFNKDGDLLISKGTKIDYEGEYSRTHLALKLYRSNNNIIGMKYCICKLWYLNIKLEEKIHNVKTSSSEKKEAEKARSKIVNDITEYSKLILKKDPTFDIIKTYQDSPFNNEKLVVHTSTIAHTIDWIKRIFTL